MEYIWGREGCSPELTGGVLAPLMCVKLGEFRAFAPVAVSNEILCGAFYWLVVKQLGFATQKFTAKV